MKTNRTISVGLLVCAYAASLAQSQRPIQVVVDGTPLEFANQQPTKQNDRVLVPLRGIFERLGAEVRWDPATQTVTARRGRHVIKLGIGLLDASIDGRDVHVDVPAILVGGSTMVPLRFVSEALGASVKWNDFDQEADITSPPIDRERPRDERPHIEPPVIRHTDPPRVTIIHEAPPVRSPIVISEDVVIPLVLNSHLSSFDSRPGDVFVATLETEDHHRYLGLPEGSQVFGHVSYARRRRGDSPGVLELQFDRLVTPRGVSYPVAGRLIGLDNDSVVRVRSGALVARSKQRDDRVAFAGAGAGIGLIIGLHDHRPIEDAAIGGLLGAVLGSKHVDRKQTRDVDLNSGTRFGLRLHQKLVIDRDVR
ncbi:MAG: stalk domain-containing protein [Fimbriimonas sp.]|nr:stalk domain-containing protein [Fimbriimonas sp.]